MSARSGRPRSSSSGRLVVTGPRAADAAEQPIQALMYRRGWTLGRYVDFLVDGVERLLLR